MSDEETGPQDPFDEIINGQSDDDSPELETIWDAIAHLWPHFYPGYVIKGIGVVEYMDEDGERMLQLFHSPKIAPWDAMGLVHSIRLDTEAADRMSLIQELAEDEDDEEQ